MNKHTIILMLVIALVCSLMLTGCGSESTTVTSTTATSTSATSTSATATSATATSATSTSATTTSSTRTTNPTTQPQYGGTLKIIFRSSLGNLGSPSEGNTVNYPVAAMPSVEFLIVADRDWNPIVTSSTLAQSFDITPDGKTITLKLREGIKFQDGTDFNAEAVKYNLEHFTTGGIVPSYLANVASFDVVDEYTLRIVLKTFDAYFLSNVSRGNAGMMVSPAAQAIEVESGTAVEHMVGTGAFKFVEWQRDNYIIYEKWDGYWQEGKPYVDRIEIRQILEGTTSLMAFKAGEADLLGGITPQDSADLQSDGFEIIVSNTMAPIVALIPNSVDSDSPFSDIRVRQALEYAIDRQAISDAMGYGFYEAATQFASTQDSRYVQGLETRNFDLEKAKQLLTEAGYPNGFKTKLSAATYTDTDLCVAIVTYLGKINIEAELEMVDPAKFSTYYNSGFKGLIVHPYLGANLSGLHNYFGPYKAGPYSLTSVIRPDGWLDTLDAGLNEPDAEKRGEIEKGLIATLHDEAMAMPICISGFFAAQTEYVHDLQWGGISNYQYRPEDAWLSK